MEYEPKSYVHQLPRLFRLNGKPYRLNQHFAMEPMFTTPLPEVLCIVSGRQVSKTTVLSARQIAIATNVPNLDILTILPLFEQTRNFSSNVVARFIHESPWKKVWLGVNSLQNVLQRGFANGSNLYFSYAGTSADRVRGKSIDLLNYDEAQDIDYGIVSIVDETMSASSWTGSAFTGTPKTLTTTLEQAWTNSSQARWVVPCLNAGCGYRNVCDERNLVKMIGPWRYDISIDNPGTVCAKCRKTVYPHFGWWEHAVPARRLRKPGYHIPQIIMPMHYGDSRKWRLLCEKVEGKRGFNVARLHNEVLGLPYDRSNTLVSQTDLERASVLPWEGWDRERALAARYNYHHLILSVDWSGGGSLTGDEVYSATAYAVMGKNTMTGKLEVIYGGKLNISADSFGEADFLLKIFRAFECDVLVHDYTGAGNQREAIMIHAGIPTDRVWPAKFVMATKGPAVRCVYGTPQHPRIVWQVDKPRCVQAACAGIKTLQLQFFKNDYKSQDDPGIISDFLNFVEHKIQTVRAGETYTIRRDPNKSDDFAMAVCQGASALWHITQSWPNFGLNMSEDEGALSQDAEDYQAVLRDIQASMAGN